MSVLDIVFGVLNPEELHIINALNYCILFAKSFIHKQKKSEGEIIFYLYQVELKNRLEIEYMLSKQGSEEGFNKQWATIYNNI